MKVLFLLPILACVFTVGQGKIYERCELAREFKKLGLDGYGGYSLADWVCTAAHESSYNTSAINHEKNGNSDYGIFQISSQYWCHDGKEQSANLCNIQCSELLTDKIAPDVACAKIVLQMSRDGMAAWKSWKEKCHKDHNLHEYVEGCDV